MLDMRKAGAAVAFVLSAAAAGSAWAQAKPEVLVDQRQSAMKLQGKYLYSLLPMANGKVPYDPRIVARNVEYLAALTQMPWDGFDSRTAEVKNTRALPGVYKDPATFKSKQDALHAEIEKLQAAVKGGNETTIKAALVDTNRACNSCHELFRAKD